MKSFFDRRGVLLSLVLSLAIGALGVSTGAMAASKTAGGIYGHAQPGATVTATSQSGLTRTTTAADDGYFNFKVLPPGTYTVREEQNGNVIGTTSVLVTINTSTHATFTAGAQQLGTIQVVGGAVNPIDVTTSNTSLVLNASQFKQLPVARDENAITLLAPSVVPSSPTLGISTTSFGGSSAAENAYFLNGLNVTDNLNFVSFSTPPFESLEEYQVLTGGLTAAYGSALGGILNVVTKSGTNTFHAGANIFWEPRGLYSSTPDVVEVTPNGLQYYDRNSDNSQGEYTYNLYASGPIVKDHLFFYALYQGVNTHEETYSVSKHTVYENTQPQGLLKVDYQINDANLLELTAYDNQQESKRDVYDLVHPNTNWFDASTDGTVDVNGGGKAYIGRYTLVPTDNFNVSAMWGYVTFSHAQSSPTETCPYVLNQINGNSVHIGCAAYQGYSGENDFDARHQARIDGEWQLGPHDITFGYDMQNFFATAHTRYSGTEGPQGNGYTFIYFAPKNCETGDLGGNRPVPGCQPYVRRRFFLDAATFTNKQHAFYLQDKWRIGNFYLRFGARTVSYTNYNPLNQAYIDINNKLAPRLGLSWDVFGDSSLKLYANAGRYFIPPSGDSNVRLAGAEYDYYDFFTYDSIDPTTGRPVNPKQFGQRVYENGGMGILPDAGAVVSKNINAMYEDEFIVGGQYRIAETQWSVGLRAIRRNLKAGMDDVCGFSAFAAGFGGKIYPYVLQHEGQAAADALPGCFLMNPGTDAVTQTPTGKIYTIPASVIGVPKATRYYNAVELLFDRAFDGKWFLHASLVWSHLYGNEEGYTLSSIGQVDSGLTESFDFPGLTDGAYGTLSNNRTWQFKMFGAYNFTPEWSVNFNFSFISGQPISCLGYYNGPINGGNAVASLYGPVAHYCYSPTGNFLSPQGSYGHGDRIYDLSGGLRYSPAFAPGLTFGMDVINIFNFHNATSVDFVSQLDSGQPNPGFLKPTCNCDFQGGFQQPRYFRFSVEYDFL
ncbi:MAG TPA: TonB-dependent receptor [Gammaproteobacteria bacterium]|nr:TonB-dependent receptor [Gammaproteobacteria bacterium]